MAEFKDHFSGHSADYAKYRPGYPAALFDWLASLVDAHDLAWDVGTGSGQAAIGLARHFGKIVATDAAAAQVATAAQHERVLYKVMPAEKTDLAAASVDLVTVAQALHWFDHDRFYAEVRRVSKPSGALVAWTYGLMTAIPAVDAIVGRYYREIVGPYWPPDRAHVDSGYRTIPFPFSEIAAPHFEMTAQWDLHDYIGYLDTWSASKRYAKERGSNPIHSIREALERAWGDAAELRTITWPLSVRAGRIASR